MPQLEVNTLAPSFTLTDCSGNPVSLVDFRDRNNVLVVCNRGFL